MIAAILIRLWAIGVIEPFLFPNLGPLPHRSVFPPIFGAEIGYRGRLIPMAIPPWPIQRHSPDGHLECPWLLAGAGLQSGPVSRFQIFVISAIISAIIVKRNVKSVHDQGTEFQKRCECHNAKTQFRHFLGVFLLPL
jgi:hypothetical protein